MKHIFKATKLGWEKEKEGIWFDSDDYTAQEARDEFKPYEGTTQRGYSYIYGSVFFYRTMILSA